MPALGQRQEKCQRGHSNWYVTKKGKRQCRTCKADWRWYNRKGFKLA